MTSLRITTCSLKGCDLEPAFDITAGDDWFENKAGAYACAFHRVEVEEILSRRYRVVQWHDHCCCTDQGRQPCAKDYAAISGDKDLCPYCPEHGDSEVRAMTNDSRSPQNVEHGRSTETHAACLIHPGQWFDKSTGACSCGASHRGETRADRQLRSPIMSDSRLLHPSAHRCGRCNWCIPQDAPPGSYRPDELVNTCPHGFGCCQNCDRCMGTEQ